MNISYKFQIQTNHWLILRPLCSPQPWNRLICLSKRKKSWVRRYSLAVQGIERLKIEKNRDLRRVSTNKPGWTWKNIYSYHIKILLTPYSQHPYNRIDHYKLMKRIFQETKEYCTDLKRSVKKYRNNEMLFKNFLKK